MAGVFEIQSYFWQHRVSIVTVLAVSNWSGPQQLRNAPCALFTETINFYRKPLHLLLAYIMTSSSRCAPAACCDKGDGGWDSQELNALCLVCARDSTRSPTSPQAIIAYSSAAALQTKPKSTSICCIGSRKHTTNNAPFDGPLDNGIERPCLYYGKRPLFRRYYPKDI